MKVANISYTKNHLSNLLERVKQGETITILDRNKPIARLVPIESSSKSTDLVRRLDELERKGIIHRGNGKSLDWIVKEPPPKLRKNASGVKYLIEERESGL